MLAILYWDLRQGRKTRREASAWTWPSLRGLVVSSAPTLGSRKQQDLSHGKMYVYMLELTEVLCQDTVFRPIGGSVVRIGRRNSKLQLDSNEPNHGQWSSAGESSPEI